MLQQRSALRSFAAINQHCQALTSPFSCVAELVFCHGLNPALDSLDVATLPVAPVLALVSRVGPRAPVEGFDAISPLRLHLPEIEIAEVNRQYENTQRLSFRFGFIAFFLFGFRPNRRADGHFPIAF